MQPLQRVRQIYMYIEGMNSELNVRGKEQDLEQGVPLLGLKKIVNIGIIHTYACIWRRKWQPTPVFFPRESCGQRSLVDRLLWGHTESDTTEVTWQQQQYACIYKDDL